MISFKYRKGSNDTSSFLERILETEYDRILHRYGKEGVAALQAATPVDTGLTASSWSYEIIKKRGTITLNFTNDNMAGSTPVAILLQYGHGTRNGGYVMGQDYINPAIRPVFEKMARALWKEVGE